MALRTAIILDLKGNLADAMRRAEQATSRLGQVGERSMRRYEAALSRVGGALDRIGNRYTALITGATAVGAARFAVQLEEQFERIGIAAELSREQVARLKQEVFATARAPGIRIDPAQLTAAMGTILQRTGDIDLFNVNREAIARAIQASGSRGEDIGGLVSEIAQKLRIRDAGEMLRTIDLFVRQGKEGAFELRDMSALGARTLAAFSRTGRTGLGAAQEFGALMQVAMMGTGSPEEAATTVENLIRELNESQKRRLIRRLGVQLMDPDDPERMRSVVEIVKEIVAASKGNQEVLGKIFDARSIRLIAVAAADFNEHGGKFTDTFERLMKIQGDGRAVMDDSARAANTMAAALTALSSALKQYADRQLSGPLSALAELVPQDPKQADRTLNLLFGGAAGLGGLILARKFGLLRFGGRAGAAGAAGAAGLASIAPQPVIVMNWPPGLMGGGAMSPLFAGAGGRGGAGAASVPAAGRMSLRQRAGRFGAPVGRGALAFGGAMAAFQTLNVLSDRGASTLEKFGGVGGAAGGFGGLWAGAKLGATLGSFAGPIGIAIGGILGGLGGSLLGSHIGEAAGEALGRTFGFGSRDRAEIHIKIDSEGRAIVRRVESSNGLFVTTDMLRRAAGRGPQMVTQP